MVLELVLSDALLMNGTPQDLFPPQLGLKHYSTKIFFDELAAGDEIIITVFDLDENAAIEKAYRTFPVEGPQTSPMQLVNWIPSSSYRVSCQQVSGSNKTITFALYTS